MKWFTYRADNTQSTTTYSDSTPIRLGRGANHANTVAHETQTMLAWSVLRLPYLTQDKMEKQMSNPDWYYDQGSPDPYEEEEEEELDICGSCGYTNCQCDAAYDDWKDNR